MRDKGVAEDLIAASLGAALIEPGSGVLTHCNTGSLATAGFGTALGVIRAGVAEGRIERVYASETRPWLQGARLTVWELLQDGIPATLIADGAAAHLMKTGAVQWVIVGADRICANGDTANKIGTYSHAIAARHHGAKVMVVAPSSTVDMATARGEDIEIEMRDPAELLSVSGTRTVAEGVQAWNPVFDVTPAGLVDAIVTERGVVIIAPFKPAVIDNKTLDAQRRRLGGGRPLRLRRTARLETGARRRAGGTVVGAARGDARGRARRRRCGERNRRGNTGGRPGQPRPCRGQRRRFRRIAWRGGIPGRESQRCRRLRLRVELRDLS